jgi:uncharacterized membrane protein
MTTTDRNTTPFPHIPAVIESDDREFQDTGVTSTVAIAGHPVHPALIVFPVAFLIGAFLTDVAYWYTRDPFWARGSFWLLVAGLIGGLVAAITGLLDFLRIERVRKRTAGWAHLIFNIVALSLTIANIIIRWNNQVGGVLPSGLLISLIVTTLLGASGWYGGELVYRHKIAVIGNGNREQP